MKYLNDRPYCTDCPDREVCSEGYPCDFVRAVNDTLQEGTTSMSNTGNNKPGPRNGESEGTGSSKAKTDLRAAEENLVETSKGLSAYINTKAIRALKDEGLTNEEIAAKAGLTEFAVIAVLSEDVLTETRKEKLKGFFNRNKNTIIGAGSAAVVVAVAAIKIYTTKKSDEAEAEDTTEIALEIE